MKLISYEVSLGSMRGWFLVCGLTLVPAVGLIAQTSDEAAIRASVAHAGKAWNAHDITMMASDWDDDVELIIPIGLAVKGKRNVVRYGETAHRTTFKNVSTLDGNVSVRFLGPDVALVTLSSHMGAFRVPSGQEVPAADSLQTWVYVRRNDRWLITSIQITNVDPIAVKDATMRRQ